MKARVLYLSYDGLLEPLGQSQVLQYLKALARDHEIVLVSYEKQEDWADRLRREEARREVREAGIRWIPLRYHRAPSLLATSFDLGTGVAVSLYLCLRHRIRVVHARSYVSSVIALALKRVLGTRYIFDMRGFWADEKVDSGAWKQSSGVYRTAKWFERQFLLRADTVVSLTHAGVETMRKLPWLDGQVTNFEVITTCTNLDYFRPCEPAVDSPITRPDEFTLGYVGTARGSYLFEPVLECFRYIRDLRPAARLLVINRGEHDYIRECVRSYGLPAEAVHIEAASYREVPEKIREMDAAAFFIKPTFSKLASAPTKLGEFLACGVPCISNSAAGDIKSLVEQHGVGVILDCFTPEGHAAAARDLVRLASAPETRQRCVELAREQFDLRVGVRAYDRIYRSLAGSA